MSEYFRKYIKKENYANHFSTNIKYKTSFRNCILEAFKRRNWKETDGDDWDIMWAEKEWIHEVMDHIHLQPHQKINHFRNHYELTRKDLMIKNLKKQKRTLEKEGKIDEANAYNFFPLTYHLPSEYPIFNEEFKKQGDNKTAWIMKPIGKSQGRGIFLFNKIQQISQWKNQVKFNPENPSAESYIVQRYIADPLLIGGKKFDTRIYLLCTSYSPLTLYLYRTGFARFTHHRYDNEDITNTYVHLTNVAIQKTSDNYDEKLGGKWDLQKLKLFLMTKYGQDKVQECFYNVQQLMIKSLLAVQKIIINDKHCFELYGFDILFDSQLKPWLLEVNASPSMTSNTPIDFELKCGLLDDVFTIIDVEKILTGNEEQIGGFDLIYKGGPIKNNYNCSSISFLGTFNNRKLQLKKLAKACALKLAHANEDNQVKSSEGTKKDKEEKEKQMRSSSKSSQIAQQVFFELIAELKQSEQSCNPIKRSDEYQEKLYGSTDINEQTKYNTEDAFIKYSTKIENINLTIKRGIPIFKLEQSLNNSSFSPNVKIESASNHQNHYLAKDSFRTLPKIAKNESYISDV
ncbi:unnamed protein product (macronuclear) [Paramecium tetraurelia]|uniref:Tubulin--tyrosine ligase-like protein 9 n=1 Tax=Paramecium tetraurelia TaxID=5888 RepID=A0CSU3_PARTE|nr:uncharacterized protein GSPATT00010132001 [Paramecium tetraurelia]CAK73860.1 unnamed protein product [Paramecium tetraurelia]|eukprot:XP_001441257.1 hypothetical protein (macronuclear) [Paramecium tetraurelia strain d4-2]